MAARDAVAVERKPHQHVAAESFHQADPFAMPA
jgi:hypothetical protein